MPQVTKDIDIIVNQLINNEIVAIPTETVYGLAASMMSTSAINKVFQAKKRPHTHPLIVHIKDKNEV
jgi:L-threonylcarbamoyladenylate synthase